jgi:hypothetical protein
MQTKKEFVSKTKPCFATCWGINSSPKLDLDRWLCTIGSYTSRKHGKKEPHSFYYCGSFDHYFCTCSTNCKLRIQLAFPLTVTAHAWRYGLNQKHPLRAWRSQLLHTHTHIYIYIYIYIYTLIMITLST